MRTHGVRSMLMGGQACVLYGAAEFSRDTDLAVLAAPENLRHLEQALAALGARVVAVPPFERVYLERGHAIHFECAAARGMRVDIMARMRNVAPFEECWERRSTFDLPGVGEVEVLGLADLVACKKTRRDKDWPMVRRLVEMNYLDAALEPTPERFEFWLRELRTPEFLLDCVQRVPDLAGEVAASRPVAAAAVAGGSIDDIAAELAAEEAAERAADNAYWTPLIRELEALRHASRSAG
ncbi:MAG: hypothetical protein ACRENI_10355 [Gemmatimonadaceae bacterium]